MLIRDRYIEAIVRKTLPLIAARKRPTTPRWSPTWTMAGPLSMLWYPAI